MKGMYTARGIRAGLTTMSFARVKSLSQSVHLIFFGCQRRPPPLFNLRTKQRTFCEAESIWGCDTACRPFGESLTGDEEPMKADRVGMHRPAVRVRFQTGDRELGMVRPALDGRPDRDCEGFEGQRRSTFERPKGSQHQVETGGRPVGLVFGKTLLVFLEEPSGSWSLPLLLSLPPRLGAASRPVWRGAVH
jgi:hypothetical protein